MSSSLKSHHRVFQRAQPVDISILPSPDLFFQFQSASYSIHERKQVPHRPPFHPPTDARGGRFFEIAGGGEAKHLVASLVILMLSINGMNILNS